MFHVILDNGHGSNTPGKCSPDGRLREWKWTREIVERIMADTRFKGVTLHRLVPESGDISLGQRVARVNSLCDMYGAKNCLLVSVHINAAGGDGKWHTASGWSGWVAPGASAASRRFASIALRHAHALGLKGNRAVSACGYWEGNFQILRQTKCPACLTENLFQDNEQEADLLLSEQGKRKITDLHVNAILEYVNSK